MIPTPTFEQLYWQGEFAVCKLFGIFPSYSVSSCNMFNAWSPIILGFFCLVMVAIFATGFWIYRSYKKVH